jgi:hypothetical protein
MIGLFPRRGHVCSSPKMINLEENDCAIHWAVGDEMATRGLVWRLFMSRLCFCGLLPASCHDFLSQPLSTCSLHGTNYFGRGSFSSHCPSILLRLVSSHSLEARSFRQACRRSNLKSPRKRLVKRNRPNVSNGVRWAVINSCLDNPSDIWCARDRRVERLVVR